MGQVALSLSSDQRIQSIPDFSKSGEGVGSDSWLVKGPSSFRCQWEHTFRESGRSRQWQNHVVNAVDKTTPGRHRGPGGGREGSWEEGLRESGDEKGSLVRTDGGKEGGGNLVLRADNASRGIRPPDSAGHGARRRDRLAISTLQDAGWLWAGLPAESRAGKLSGSPREDGAAGARP